MYEKDNGWKDGHDQGLNYHQIPIITPNINICHMAQYNTYQDYWCDQDKTASKQVKLQFWYQKWIANTKINTKILNLNHGISKIKGQFHAMPYIDKWIWLRLFLSVLSILEYRRVEISKICGRTMSLIYNWSNNNNKALITNFCVGCMDLLSPCNSVKGNLFFFIHLY